MPAFRLLSRLKPSLPGALILRQWHASHFKYNFYDKVKEKHETL